MSNLGFSIDPNDPELEEQERGPIPPGRYKVVITSCTSEVNKKRTGKLLTMELALIDRPFRGRKLYDRLNISHENELAQRIGRSRLASYAKATKFVGLLTNTDVFLGKILGVQVVVSKDKGDERERNGIEKVFAVEREQAEAAAAPARSEQLSEPEPWR